jgi:DNA-binding PadR family transcriptional regulator
MAYTKEQLENLKNDPMMNSFARMFGLDLNKIIEEEKKALDEKFNEVKQFHDTVANVLDDMVKEGTLTCEEKTENGVTTKYYHAVEKPKEVPEEPKKEYVKPEVKEQHFLMSESQLEKFIKTYRELLDTEKKLSYLYGIEFTDGESGFGFPSKVNEMVWNFVRIIFGDENAEDIADYVFGTSNFDDVKSLYDELV